MTGCAAVPGRPPDAESAWKPEITIRAEKPLVRDAIADSMIRSGYQTSSQNDYTLVFERPDSGDFYRITFNLIGRTHETYVSARCEAILNPRSPQESSSDKTNSAFWLQDFLSRLKSRLEADAPPIPQAGPGNPPPAASPAATPAPPRPRRSLRSAEEGFIKTVIQ